MTIVGPVWDKATGSGARRWSCTLWIVGQPTSWNYYGQFYHYGYSGHSEFITG